MSSEEVRQVYSVIRWVVTGFASLGTIILGWLLHLERRPPGMTHKEHEMICERRERGIADQLLEIKRQLDRQDDRSEAHRSNVAAVLSSMGSDIAVLKSRSKL